MENSGLQILLESVLGEGKHTGKGNVAFYCPFCHHPRRKLEVQLNTNENSENPWHCWTCPDSNSTKGKTIHSLFTKLKVSKEKFYELKMLIKPVFVEKKPQKALTLPEEFISLSSLDSLEKTDFIFANRALSFLKKRKIKEVDIIKYNIGFCNEGIYKDRIIIPSYDSNGVLNYFVARDYTDTLPYKYLNPPIEAKNVIGFELYINWKAPIILVEGIFDALTIKRNVIPLFGKMIHNILMKKIVTSEVQKIYIALDRDAIKKSIKYCEELLKYGKEVYLVEIEGKDVNEVGYNKFLNTLENTSPLTFQSLVETKLKLL